MIGTGENGMGERLRAEKEALHDFSIAMEEEFLKLGALLRTISLSAGQVRERSDAVIVAASGREEDAAIQFAFQLLKKTEDLVQASRDQYHHVLAVFKEIQIASRHIASRRRELKSTVSPLKAIPTLFRIQASLLSEKTQNEFSVVANSIQQIISEIESGVGQRFEELELMAQTALDLTAQLSVLTTQQNHEIKGMLEDARSHLSTLDMALQSSEAAAQSLVQVGDRISSGVGKAIIALQCQDIARQKFEHITEAIDQMIDRLPNRPGSDYPVRGARPDPDCLHYLADAGSVQLKQLRVVFGQLGEAARQVSGGLQEVESGAKALADHAVRSGDATLDGHVIGLAIKSIKDVLGIIDKTVGRVQSMCEIVQDLKSKFGDCGSQVADLTERLSVMALNAQISATQADAGLALEVVARNTRILSDQSRQALEAISSRVAALIDSITDVEQRLADHRELASIEQKLLAAEAGLSEKKLRALEEELHRGMGVIEPLNRKLSETIHRTIGSIRFPDAVAIAEARSTALFEAIVRQRPADKRESRTMVHGAVHELRRNYTMVDERAVHESAVGMGRSVDAIAMKPPSQTQIGEIADNVELF